MNIHQRFKLIRKELKMTQTELGKKIGKKLRTIQDYEYEKATITDGVLLALQEKFNVNIDWMRTGQGEMFLNNNNSNNNNNIDNNNENIKSLSITYNLPQKFLKLVFQLNQNELEKVEGYIEALIENRKIYEKERQRLSS